MKTPGPPPLDPALLAETLDRIGDGVAVLDAEGRAVFQNDRLTALLGPDALDRIASDTPLPALTDQDARTLEIDGRWFRLRVLSLDQGRHLVTLTDTTDQRRNEALATERAEQLTAILEHVPHGVSYLDAAGDLVLANDEFYDSFAFPRSMGPGTPGIDFTRRILAQQSGLSGAALDEAAAARLARIYRECANDEISWDWEHLDDGRIIEIRRRLTPQGSLVETYIDVTERENALRDAEAAVDRYRAVVEDQSEMICRFDADYRLTFANNAYSDAFQTPGSALIGTRFLDLIPEPEVRAALAAGLERLTPETPSFEDTFRETTVDGRESWQTWINRALFDGEGRLIEYQAVGRDVTTEREARDSLAQAEKLSAMGSLLASVSHELNNPLSILVGQSQLLLDQAPDTSTADRATRIKDAADRCARIVRTFLAMARQKPPTRAPVNLTALIAEAVELVAYAMRTSDVALQTDLPDTRLLVSGDHDQLIQVVVNLLINAQQALWGQDGSRQVAIVLSAEDGTARLTVSDNGPGVRPALQSKIFEPFFTTKPEGIGTGIGLAMCRNIVVGHDGHLAYRPAPGGGAAFVVELPLADAADQSDDTAEIAAAFASLPPLTILFVDDEEEIAQTAREIVGRDGHQVLTAAHGRAALEILERDEVDLVITDLRMPVMDGPTLWRTLAASGAHPTSAVGIVTGDALSPEIQRFLEEVDAPMAEKPLSADDLRRLIVEVVSADV